MAGPHPPNYGVGAAGPPPTDPHPGQPLPRPHGYAVPYPGTSDGEAAARSAAYPGPLPPPVPYPMPRRPRWAVIAAVLAVALVAALVALTVYVVRGSESNVAISEGQARAAIQGYLDALSNRDIETIARNTLCGIYDAVRAKQSDDAVAKLNSDAFRKQFAEAEVTSIDKMVFLSDYQAQALFTMRVVSTAGGEQRDTQGVAQLLATDHQILVCSYVLHTSGTY